VLTAIAVQPVLVQIAGKLLMQQQQKAVPQGMAFLFVYLRKSNFTGRWYGRTMMQLRRTYP
jgi:hypothetical protein